jgi:hypothetical protein
MGYILIKDLQEQNILITSTTKSYKLMYKTDHSVLSGISLRLHDITIKEGGTDYSITINDKVSVDTLRLLDTYLAKHLNVKPLVRDNILTLKKNTILDRLIKKYSDTLDIYIFMIKKVAYQVHPIVYVL